MLLFFLFSKLILLFINILKTFNHTLVWWKSYKRQYDIWDLTWKQQKMMVKKLFYPIWYDEMDKWKNWNLIKQYMSILLISKTKSFCFRHGRWWLRYIHMYVENLVVYIQKGLKLFIINTIEETMKAIVVEAKYKGSKNEFEMEVWRNFDGKNRRKQTK